AVDGAVEELWLHALGEVLLRLNDADAAEYLLEADRTQARRMMRTGWVSAEAIQVQPYLDGEPAGTESALPIAWISDRLYVEGDSVHAYKALVKDLVRPFSTSAAVDIIRDCVGGSRRRGQNGSARRGHVAIG
ncbi:MAG TPA: hypothetical protein VMT32_17155, partial [Bryobacteraceae bacterium]|nr:hypothetical protein [Bryobacteraceae bacterium]